MVPLNSSAGPQTQVAVLGMFTEPGTAESRMVMNHVFDMKKSQFLSRGNNEGVVSSRRFRPYLGEWMDHDVAVGQLIKGAIPEVNVFACDGGDRMRYANLASECISEARVVSLSWRLPGLTKYSSVRGMGAIPSFFPNRFNFNGIMVVSAGNDGGTTRSSGVEIVGGGTKVYVAALDESGELADYSNVAPDEIVFAARGDINGVRVGTSFAAPRVAAALAKLISDDPGLSNREAIEKLQSISRRETWRGVTVYALPDQGVRKVASSDYEFKGN